MGIPITLMYASVFALFALFLSFRAGSYRGKTGYSILYGEPRNMELAQRVRAQQNFLEYVPFVMILMGLLEANGANSMFLFVVGDVLFIGRVAHAIGLKHDNIAHKGRVIGMLGTMLPTVACAGYGLWIAWGALV